MTVGALQRAIDRAADRRSGVVERCGLCAAAVAEGHRHVLDGRDDTPMCVCTACTLLFDRDGAGGGQYRLIPTRRLRLAGLSTEPLGVPVGIAFFVKHHDGRVIAHYPSPLGDTRAEVDPVAWTGVEAASPALAGMRPAVEALLVRANREGGAGEHWILPVDACYRLVAVIRRHWTGMAGGAAVWREVARFFSELRPEELRQEEGPCHRSG
jgi:hypothetical protein